jgi:hypothetical protein
MNRKRREDLIAALNTAMRDASGACCTVTPLRSGFNSTDLVLRGPLSAGALAEATGL